jgi:hypothetical protein
VPSAGGLGDVQGSGRLRESATEAADAAIACHDELLGDVGGLVSLFESEAVLVPTPGQRPGAPWAVPMQ